MEFQINNRRIGPKTPVYIVAEISANHHQDFDQAVKLIEAAKKAGADAVKLQTYTPDTITIDCEDSYFQAGRGTPWEGRLLYDLYSEAFTPWEWQPKLKKIADEIEIDLFSTPFDHTAVDFLEKMDVPAYKIASFEIVDIPMIQKIAKTGKPIIMSTGMATLSEIEEAIHTIRKEGNNQTALLKCTSSYPALPEDMNLATIPHMAEAFDLIVGLSDHTLDVAVPVAAVTLGARIIEKHFTLSRDFQGPDSDFSLEPDELKAMVKAIRTTEKGLGKIYYGTSKTEEVSRLYRRSLFAVQEIKANNMFTSENVRSIRPGHGLHPRYLYEIIGKQAKQDIERGMPLSWSLVK
jgi:pseudaminic acid synthase